MSTSEMLEHEHTQRTRRNQYGYLFTAKHHGGDKTAAQWRPDLSPNDEFAVFDEADDRELTDDDGNLFGALPEGEDSLRMLGTLQGQIAKFPRAAESSPWHGYPHGCFVNRNIDRRQRFSAKWQYRD